MRDEDAGEQSTDASKTVEHDIHCRWCVFGTVLEHGRELGCQELSEVAADFAVAIDEFGEVDGGRIKGKRGQRNHERHGFFDRKFCLIELAGKAMRLEHFDGRLIDEAPTVDRGDDAVVAIQPTDERNHCLGQFLAGIPSVKFVAVFALHQVPSDCTVAGLMGAFVARGLASILPERAGGHDSPSEQNDPVLSQR